MYLIEGIYQKLLNDSLLYLSDNYTVKIVDPRNPKDYFNSHHFYCTILIKEHEYNLIELAENLEKAFDKIKYEMKSKVKGLKFTIKNKDDRGGCTVLSNYTNKNKNPTIEEFINFMIKHRGKEKLHTDEILEIEFYIE